MNIRDFQFIDAIEKIDTAGTKIIARSTVPDRDPLFETHFPGKPVFPATLLIEVMAQACALLVLRRDGCTRLPMLIRADEVRVRKPVTPGTGLRIAAEIEQEGSGYAQFKAHIESGGGPVGGAILRLHLSEAPAQFRAMLAKRLDEQFGADPA